jgi:hypothetical protein
MIFLILYSLIWGEFEKRMYFLVNRSISPIQKGIQAGHAALEYCRKFKDQENLWNFIRDDKTWIILDGGTSRDDMNDAGDLETIDLELYKNHIDYAKFKEPDLNWCLTAIVLIVDERVFNKELYPDFREYLFQKNGSITTYSTGLGFSTPLQEQYPEDYKIWVELIGGPQNEFLRTFLS